VALRLKKVETTGLDDTSLDARRITVFYTSPGRGSSSTLYLFVAARRWGNFNYVRKLLLLVRL
jgi:hypothetical protein